jgi:hypothetical protein
MKGKGQRAKGNGPMPFAFFLLLCALCLLPSALCLLPSALSAAPRPQTFTGTITDSMCSNAGHSSMRMGPTDAECTIACIDAHGALYVLYDGKNVFTLSDQQQPARFAGRRVKIVGTLDAKTKTIAVQSITAIIIP